MTGLRAAFMLSTGRSGTGTLAHLCQQSSLAMAYHVPAPEMIEENFLVQQGIRTPEEVVGMKVAGIRELVAEHERAEDKVYVETNSKLSLLAAALDRHFDCRFMWVIRDPFQFVNSGLNRKWYSGKGGIWDQTRERPVQGWPRDWGPTEKIAWLWCEINSGIERQIDRLAHPPRVCFLEELLSDAAATVDLMHWLGLPDLDEADVRRIYDLHINSGMYSAPRDDRTGDHIFGQRNEQRMPELDFDQRVVRDIIHQHWPSARADHYLQSRAVSPHAHDRAE
ncbi:MAG: hypothetical protein JSV91_14025 [Phycisphaerales bacterium]|nr:MAG: hypothetical protein JSV91_14025 [Phycisphaerales bacterium]